MNKSLQEKSSARLAAAQLLYQNELTGDDLSPSDLINQYEMYLEDSDERQKEMKLPKVTANLSFMRKLITGVQENQLSLEPLVDKAIVSGWVKSRMSPLLLSILRLGIFELAHFDNVKTGVIINEYVTLSSQFFSEAEVGFVNAALASAADHLRNTNE